MCFVDIINAKVQPIQVKDRHCFEITAAVAGKKGHKKYVFAAENQYERDQWVEQLKKNSTLQIAILNGEEENPLHAAKVNNGDDDEEGGSAANFEEDNGRNMSQSVRSSVVPIEMSGYLMKKSPAMMKGWQKRYFKTLENGDIAYYKSVSHLCILEVYLVLI